VADRTPFAVALSRGSLGLRAPLVRVEAYVSGGLSAFGIVGLAETAVRESRDRVRGAIHAAQLTFPLGRISVNLAPADLPKAGGRFDLPIALALLAASGQIDPRALEGVEVVGELSLLGQVRGVRGVLSAARAAAAAGRPILVPAANGAEAALPPGVEALAARDLNQVVDHLRGRSRLPHAMNDTAAPAPSSGRLADVRGHAGPKRALVVAAAPQPADARTARHRQDAPRPLPARPHARAHARRGPGDRRGALPRRTPAGGRRASGPPLPHAAPQRHGRGPRRRRL
jgi:magnesium chelatase family protein